jgi:ATP-dependent exoDNAse (exonuclease V) alpha subunit
MLRRAVGHIFEREAVVTGHKVLAEALNSSLGYINLDKLRECMTGQKTGLIQLTQNVKNPLLSSQWTSERHLHLERWAVEFVNQTQNSCNAFGKTDNVDFEFKSEEQCRVVLDTLNNRDRVYAIRGRAGTGKTTCLSEIRKGLEAAGRTVYYLAPVSSAVEVLKKDGFTNAITVSGFLANRPENLRDAAVIIDEASLNSNELGAAVMDAARNARILFVGDTRQHVSVEAGDFLRVLEQHSNLKSSELMDIRRQEPKEYNSAVRTLSDGKAVSGMKQIDDLGWIENARGSYIEKASDEYIARTEDGSNLDQCIAIAPTWAENYHFTEAIRKKLKERAIINDGVNIKVFSQLDWTKEQRANADNYAPGMFITFNAKKNSIASGKTLEVERVENDEIWLKDRRKPIKPEKYASEYIVSEPRNIELSIGDKVLVRRNHHDTGLINGNVLTVGGINKDGSIETREGKHIPAEFRHFTHGYVVTSHKSQGRSHKYEVVASERLDAVAAYVALSRGRKSARVFTPDKENLFENLGKPTDRLAVMDVLNKERKKYLHQNEDKDFQQSVQNPLTEIALQYARNSNYGIDYGDGFKSSADVEPAFEM